ncbi:hypothetical protein GALL_225620 [mine drainage metagenome]|uniref:Nitrate reductase molybdenum cofactor assembly chaperone n=1 Tax=mine drainage metagenome TaxID=410659 RepID=A0A1J5RHY9_9ZZZZ
MAKNLEIYKQFAGLFRYPRVGFADELLELRNQLEMLHLGDLIEFEKYVSYMLALNLREREEIFLKTFEIQAICHLEIGYVLFGEDYKRGLFLAGMKEEHHKRGHDYGLELPDHLSNVLDLFSGLDDEELVKDIAELALIPAVRAMLSAFDEKQIRGRLELLKKKQEAIVQEELNYGNPYRYALDSLLKTLESDFPGVPEGRQDRAAGNFIPIHRAEGDEISVCALACPPVELAQGD